MIDFVVTPPIMKIALCVAMETSKNTISTWIVFEDFFFCETRHLSDTETVDKISQGISCGSRVIFG